MSERASVFDAPEKLADAVLSGAMGTAHPDCDKALRALAKHVLGVSRSDARFKRRAERLAEEVANQIVKGASLRHEIRRLEETLSWIYRTTEPIEAIQDVVRKTIPRRIARSQEAARHGLDAVFSDGESWKAICSCGWECWNRPTEDAARHDWQRHLERTLDDA